MHMEFSVRADSISGSQLTFGGEWGGDERGRAGYTGACFYGCMEITAPFILSQFLEKSACSVGTSYVYYNTMVCNKNKVHQNKAYVLQTWVKILKIIRLWLFVVHLPWMFPWVSNWQRSCLGQAALWNLRLYLLRLRWALRDECPEGNSPLPFLGIYYLLILCFFPVERSLALTTNKQGAAASTNTYLRLSLCEGAYDFFLLILVLLISKEGKRHCFGYSYCWRLCCQFANDGRAWLFLSIW